MQKGYEIVDRRAESVEKLIKNLFPDEKMRERCLKIFSECIIQADESGSNKWGIHVKKDRIRLLVGSLIVCTVMKDKIWLGLYNEAFKASGSVREIIESSECWSWDTEDYPEYSKVPSRNGYYLLKDESIDLWNYLKEFHFQLISKAGKKYKRLQVKSQKSHEPAFITFVSNAYNIHLPVPDHDTYYEDSASIEELENIIASVNKLSIPETEKEALIKSRVGQGMFRTQLKIFWNNCCSVTQCTLIDLLTASHIKPWRDSTNEERLDRYNGLLLLPNLDSAFDKGYISFNNDGSILISDKLTKAQMNALGIDGNLRLSRVEHNHFKYLEYHRNYIFSK